jgi:glycerol-3-phosphate dehydrogenase
MLSVAGGKLTTYRRIALAVLHALRSDLALHRIDRRPHPLLGAADPDAAADALRRRRPDIEASLAAQLAARRVRKLRRPRIRG